MYSLHVIENGNSAQKVFAVCQLDWVRIVSMTIISETVCSIFETVCDELFSCAHGLPSLGVIHGCRTNVTIDTSNPYYFASPGVVCTAIS
jgi:hypothetical protein